MSFQTARLLRSQLHISHSQIFTYLACSLKYKFQYVEKRSSEKLSIALPFGKAIHSGVEHYYRSLKETGSKIEFERMLEKFTESLRNGLESSNVPIIFKKDMPDGKAAEETGKLMLKAFWERCDIQSHQVVAIELPLSAELVDEHGVLLDIQLMGIVDLLLQDRNGRSIVVDLKTAKQSKSQADADADLQMSAYSFLLAANGYIFPKADTMSRFDVLRKLKTPTFEQIYTVRTAEDRRRFLKLASAVLTGINNRIFIPCKSWLCADCQHSEACKNW